MVEALRTIHIVVQNTRRVVDLIPVEGAVGVPRFVVSVKRSRVDIDDAKVLPNRLVPYSIAWDLVLLPIR